MPRRQVHLDPERRVRRRRGDTIAVCPGTYVEGGGGVGSNGIIIVRNVTIKGAGADLVTIKPRRVTASGGQIAAATPFLRDATGNIITIDGDNEQATPNAQKTSLLTVNISGVTIDGNGVYAEAGVLFRDAQGTITRSRVTNVVTTEKSYDAPRAGEYKGSSDGIAVASVVGANRTGPAVTTPLPATPRVVKIDHSRIEKYNSTGILLDGATGDAPPLTASGVVTQGTIAQDQIVGRTLCVDFESTGNCSNPQLATNGPLYGQDGIRVTAGSTAALVDNTISQNIVQGTGSPVRSSNTVNNSTNNDKLGLAADVRLIGAGPSTFTRNNFVDSSYGLMNVGLDGATANSATPAEAENNWWGLRFNAQTGNSGPWISPAFNPPTPETAVNGAAVADEATPASNTSDAVDFFPYRNGFQSDTGAGQFPTLDVPGPVNDAAPAVDFATDKATYHLGDTVRFTATPTDDFGVRSLMFYDGPWLVASASNIPYVASYRLPTDIGCANRTLTAVVEDSSGQTASKTHAIAIDPADCAAAQPTPTTTPTATPTASATPEGNVNAASTGLSLAFANAPRRVPARGADVTAVPTAKSAVTRVDFFLGTHQLCKITAAPYRCRIVARGSDVGLQSLRAVVVDATGASAEVTTRVEIPRFAPRGLTVAVASKKHGAELRKTISGKLRLPARVDASDACGSGSGSR